MVRLKSVFQNCVLGNVFMLYLIVMLHLLAKTPFAATTFLPMSCRLEHLWKSSISESIVGDFMPLVARVMSSWVVA